SLSTPLSLCIRNKKREQRRKFGLLKPRIRTNTKSKLNLTQHINKGRNMVDPDTQLLADNSVATMRDTALSDFDKQMDMNDEEVNLITTGNAYEITIETSRDHDASDVITEQPEEATPDPYAQPTQEQQFHSSATDYCLLSQTTQQNLISLSVEPPKLNMRDQNVVKKAKKIAANAAFSENQDPFESDSQHTVVEETKSVTRICTPTSVRVARSNRLLSTANMNVQENFSLSQPPSFIYPKIVISSSNLSQLHEQPPPSLRTVPIRPTAPLVFQSTKTVPTNTCTISKDTTFSVLNSVNKPTVNKTISADAYNTLILYEHELLTGRTKDLDEKAIRITLDYFIEKYRFNLKNKQSELDYLALQKLAADLNTTCFISKEKKKGNEKRFGFYIGHEFEKAVIVVPTTPTSAKIPVTIFSSGLQNGLLVFLSLFVVFEAGYPSDVTLLLQYLRAEINMHL
ncbi:unnamed protein product, partial [Didymodactylos carnosus]